MDRISTKQLVINDDQDRCRISLTTDGDGNPSITMHDAMGGTRIALQVIEAGDNLEARLTLRAGADGHVAKLSAGRDGHAALTLMRKDAQPLVVLEVEAGDDARPFLSMFNPADVVALDEQGKPRWEPQMMCYLTVTEEGEPYLQLMDASGDYTFRFPFQSGDLEALLKANTHHE